MVLASRRTRDNINLRHCIVASQCVLAPVLLLIIFTFLYGLCWLDSFTGTERRKQWDCVWYSITADAGECWLADSAPVVLDDEASRDSGICLMDATSADDDTYHDFSVWLTKRSYLWQKNFIKRSRPKQSSAGRRSVQMQMNSLSFVWLLEKFIA